MMELRHFLYASSNHTGSLQGHNGQRFATAPTAASCAKEINIHGMFEKEEEEEEENNKGLGWFHSLKGHSNQK